MRRIVQERPTRRRGEHVRVKAVVLLCSDPGFKAPLKALMRLLEVRSGEGDMPSVAGGVRDIASPSNDGDRAYVLGQIEKAVRLHHVGQVILTNHADCGAYGYLQFQNEDDERQFYAEDLRKAEKVLRDHLRGIGLKPAISKYFLDFHGALEIR